MIVRYHDNWPEKLEAMIPVVYDHNHLLSIKVCRASAGNGLYFPFMDSMSYASTLWDPVAVYNLGATTPPFCWGASTYYDCTRIDNSIFITRESTSKLYKTITYELYDPYIHVNPGTPGTNKTPASYRFDYHSTNPKITRLPLFAYSAIVASYPDPPTSITILEKRSDRSSWSGNITTLTPVQGVWQRGGFYKRISTLSYTINGTSCPVYAVFANLGGLESIPSGGYSDYAVGVGFQYSSSSWPSDFRCAILDQIVGIDKPT